MDFEENHDRDVMLAIVVQLLIQEARVDAYTVSMFIVCLSLMFNYTHAHCHVAKLCIITRQKHVLSTGSQFTKLRDTS